MLLKFILLTFSQSLIVSKNVSIYKIRKKIAECFLAETLNKL